MTREETALDVLRPVLEAMREKLRQEAVDYELNEAGDMQRREAAQSTRLLNEIETRIEMEMRL